MPIVDIESGDFVNEGRDKVNAAFGEIPVAFACTPDGILTITRHNGDVETVPLKNYFAQLDNIDEINNPGQATTDTPGSVLLADPDDSSQNTSPQRVLSAAAIQELLERLRREFPLFDLDNLAEGNLFMVEKTTDNQLVVRSKTPVQVFNAFSDAVYEIICGRITALGCGGGNSKVLSYIRIEGPNSFPKNQTRTYQIRAYYADGTNAIVTNGLFSIQGTDIVINEQTGLVTPGPNAVVNGPYTITATYLGKTHSKGITLTASAIAWTRRNVPPRYFEPVGLLGPNYDGSLDTVNCDKITGWITDVNHPNTVAQARLFINGILAATVTATQPRSDVTTYLNLANTTGHIYGFEFAVPNSFRNGSPLVVELKPVSGSNAMRYSPKTSAQGCLDLSNLINVAAGKTATANSVISGTAWQASHLTDEDPTTPYSSDCAASAAGPIIIQIDLNGTASPQQIKIQPRIDVNALLPVTYYFDGSVNGTDWFRMATVNNQPRTSDEIVIPVETNLEGLYRSCRYVRMTVTDYTTQGDGCYYVQMAGISVMAPSLTPVGQEPPTRQPQQLLIQGDNALSEGTHKDYIVSLQYTNGDIENVTSTANLSVTGIAVSVALVDGKMRLTADDDGTTTVVRTATLKATVPGLQATKDVSVYNSTVSDYIVNFRIDWNTAVQSLTEGTTNTVKVTAVKASGATEQYTGSGAYSIIAPYPNGMTLTTGANAIGTLTLPGNSITANLNITIRFTFPAGNGVIEKVIQLINVNDTPVTFTGYEIAGDATLTESATQSVTRNYVVNSVYSDGSRVAYTGAGSFSADAPFPDGMSVTTPGNGTGLLTLLSNSITGDVPVTLRFTFPDNGTITKVVTLQNTDGCTQHAKLTQAEVDAMSKISIYEYKNGSQQTRPFASRNEAISVIPTHNQSGSFSRFDFNPCTSETAEVGAILYNDNRPDSTQYPDAERFLRPVEAGWWGWNRVSATDFYVLQTDACGNIISKEHITL